MTPEIRTEIMFIAPMLLQLVGLAFAVLIDNYIRKNQRRIMLLIVVLIFTLLIQNYLHYILTTVVAMPYVRTVVGIYGYSVRPVIIILFFYVVCPDRNHLPAWILAIVNALVYLTALFSHLSFYISTDNHFFRGPLGYCCHVVSSILLAYLVYLSVREYSRVRKSEALIPVLNVLLIIVATLLDMDGRFFLNADFPLLTVAVIHSSVFYYIWLHLQFVRAHERALIDEQHFQIMLAQIQPHFLYNSLGSIRSTCLDDPLRARNAIDQFTEFLRHNMDSLTDDQPIAFKTELEHVKRYLELQQLRFGDVLNVEYDLECADFRLPTLTLQPIVENAVTYGVRKSKKGRGTVIIRSREYPDRFEVSVIDSGPGFVPDTLPGDSERSHIGIQNVRDRLRRNGGELQIHSVLGGGTTVTIILPKDKEES